MEKKYKSWTSKEKELFLDRYRYSSINELCIFFKRNVHSIKNMASRLGLKTHTWDSDQLTMLKGQFFFSSNQDISNVIVKIEHDVVPWTDQEVEELKILYPNCSIGVLIGHFDKQARHIVAKADFLGLKRFENVHTHRNNKNNGKIVINWAQKEIALLKLGYEPNQVDEAKILFNQNVASAGQPCSDRDNRRKAVWNDSERQVLTMLSKVCTYEEIAMILNRPIIVTMEMMKRLGLKTTVRRNNRITDMLKAQHLSDLE